MEAAWLQMCRCRKQLPTPLTPFTLSHSPTQKYWRNGAFIKDATTEAYLQADKHLSTPLKPSIPFTLPTQKYWRKGAFIKDVTTEAYLQADKQLLTPTTGFLGMGKWLRIG